MQRGLVIVAVLLVLAVLYAIACAETGYRVVAVYVAGNLSAKHLDLVETVECNDSLRAAIYASNHTKGPSLVIIYARSGAEYSRASIAQCLRSVIEVNPGTMYLPLSFTMAEQAKNPPKKIIKKESIITSINNVTQGLSSQVTTRLVAKVTRTTITPTTTTLTTTKRTTTAPEVLHSSASASTATPVSMPGAEHTVRGAGLSPSERLGLVLGSAIAAAVLVYVAWRIKIG